MTFSAGESEVHDEATPETDDSDDESRSPRTVIRDEPQPDDVSNAATDAGVDASDDSTSTRRPGAHSRSTRDTERPTAVTTEHDSADQPMRARASETDETAGTTRTGAPYSRSVVAIPETNGSPEARATTERPAYSARRPGSPAASGDGHGTRV